MYYGKLRRILPEQVYDELLDVSTKYQICTPLRLAHFLSQCAHESTHFTRTTENLNYSAERLVKVFTKYFNYELAEEYERKPAKIASHVYANRMGNGSEESHDGWKYRGRGYIQLTGRSNYEAFDLVITESIIANPDLVATKYPLLSAAWFWDMKELNRVADDGATLTEVKTITLKINGGLNGLQERHDYFNQFYEALNG